MRRSTDDRQRVEERVHSKEIRAQEQVRREDRRRRKEKIIRGRGK